MQYDEADDRRFQRLQRLQRLQRRFDVDDGESVTLLDSGSAATPATPATPAFQAARRSPERSIPSRPEYESNAERSGLLRSEIAGDDVDETTISSIRYLGREEDVVGTKTAADEDDDDSTGEEFTNPTRFRGPRALGHHVTDALVAGAVSVGVHSSRGRSLSPSEYYSDSDGEKDSPRYNRQHPLVSYCT